jgi:exodeoxyribonuclease VII small subunit
MNKDINYEEALKELKQILSEVQDPNIELHVLEEKMKRAKMLMELCQSSLKALEDSIN